jgi:renalase
MITPPVYDVAVIGAGLAGLVAANHLQEAGYSVLVVDKGRGVGGRLATRRFADCYFDHGAQYFTANTPAFQALTNQWVGQGWVQPWFTQLAVAGGITAVNPLPKTRYVPTAGATSLAKALAQPLTLSLSQRVVALTPQSQGHWQLTTEQLANPSELAYHQAKQVIITSPLPQTLALLTESQITLENQQQQALQGVSYNPSLTLMLALNELNPTPQCPSTEGFKGNGDPLGWVGFNHHKADLARLSQHPALTVQASPQASLQHFEAPNEAIKTLLLQAIAPYLPIAEAHIIEWQLHRWRYAFLANPLAQPFMALANTPLPCYLAGDAFGEAGKVETAVLSGLAAAQALINA